MKKIVMMVIGFFVALVVFISVFDSYTVVNSGNRGLKFTFGELSNTELEEGLHFKVPFAQKIKEVTIQPIGQEITIPVGQDGACYHKR